MRPDLTEILDGPLPGPGAVPDTVRRNHLHLSEADWAFRLQAFENSELMQHETFSALHESLPLLIGMPSHDWPTFVSRQRMDELARVTLDVVRLVRSIPERIFDLDAQRLADYYGRFQPAALELLLAEPNGIDTSLARTDFFWTPDDLKCLEVNLSSNSGGWETAVLCDRYLAVPEIAAFVEEQGLEIDFEDPLELLYEHILDTVEAQVRDVGSEVDVAFVVDPGASLDNREGSLAFLRAGFEAVRERRNVGGRVVLCSADKLQVRRGTVAYEGRRVHAIMELYLGLPRQDLFRAFKAGRVALFNGPLEPILTDKRNLALLSEYEDSDRFDAAEREIIARHIPWGRIVREGKTTFHGDPVDLVPFLESERERMVVKPPLDRGGKNVIIGPVVTPEEWRAALDEALAAGDWLAQEWIASRTYLERWGSDGVDSGAWLQDRVWGPFQWGDRYAGALLRQQPVSNTKPINASLGEATLSAALVVKS